MPVRSTATLLISCPDARGIVAAVSGFLFARGANILSTDEHRDDASGQFLMRIEWEMEGFSAPEGDFSRELREQVADRFSMQWRVEYSVRPPRMAVFVSRYLHCLGDILYRHKSGELPGEIPLVISNHEEAQPLAAFYGIPFHLVPVTPETRQSAEQRQLELLRDHGVDLIALARYMQVLSPAFVQRYEAKIINVHHSFLPAFSGAKPYHAAFARGVKLIGATAHYVTEILDDGPIIDQEVIRVSHRDQLEDLIEKGRDAERMVLSRAVRWHLEHRILLYGNKTVVFV